MKSAMPAAPITRAIAQRMLLKTEVVTRRMLVITLVSRSAGSADRTIRASLFMVATPLERRHAERSAKDAREMTLVVEAGAQRDVCERILRRDQPPRGSAHANRACVLADRRSEVFAKGARQMALVHSSHFDKVRERQVSFELFV